MATTTILHYSHQSSAAGRASTQKDLKRKAKGKARKRRTEKKALKS